VCIKDRLTHHELTEKYFLFWLLLQIIIKQLIRSQDVNRYGQVVEILGWPVDSSLPLLKTSPNS
jgi:hypothetical protein